MSSRPIVSHASTILDQISIRASSSNLWTGVQLLSVVFVVIDLACRSLLLPGPDSAIAPVQVG